MFPPLLEDAATMPFNRLTNPINLAGLPALSLPVPSSTAIPASLQLVGGDLREDLLLTTGLRVETANGGSPFRR
jgi:Asp-tRNA(Asn)/Glu-tRNA(Gln) amidotransferase A subunit family amidase